MPSAGIGSKVIGLAGAVASGFSKTYWFVTGNNAAAQTHVGGATNTYLNNNGLSSDTASYNPDSKSVIWNPATNSYDFTSLKIGDTIHITGRLLFNNAAAQEVDMILSAAEGTASVHEHTLNHTYYKTAKVGTSLTFNSAFVIRNADERDGPTRIRFESLDAASITVVSWTTIVTSV
jgi:hypothetical protein